MVSVRNGRSVLVGSLVWVAAGVSLPALGQDARPTPPPPPAAAPPAATPPPGAAPAGAPTAAPATIDRFMKIRAPGSPIIAPDGSLYVRDWPDGVNQLYRARNQKARAIAIEGEPAMERLTDFKDGLSSYTISPDGKTILLAAAAGGNEQTQLYTLDPATDEISPLLVNPKVVYSHQVWLRDSSGFLYTANDTSPADFHIYRFDLATGQSTKLLGREGSWDAPDVTDDGTRALVGRYISASEAEVYELDLATGALTDLSIRNPDGTLASTSAIGYLPDEKSVALASDVQDGIRQVYVRDLAEGAAGEPRAAIPSLDAFEIDDAEFNDSRDLLAVAVNEGGFGYIRVYEVPGFEQVKLPNIARGVQSISDFRASTLVWTVSSTHLPGIAFKTELKPEGGGEVKQITWADTQGIDLRQFALPELVKYPSFDGVEIPAFLSLPPGHTPGTPVPFVVIFHGGPEGQHRPFFDRTAQFLLSRGYGVLQPNVRGSTGYGRDFQMLDNYANRMDSVRDGVEAARWLIASGHATPGKIAAYGGSYGGFMSVATVIEGAEVFGASVNVVGIVNFKTFLEQTKDYRRKLREVEYGPLTDPDFLASISPINRIDDINVPMFIAHGLNDPRVPVGEALQLHVGLAKRGLDPQLLIFPDEGHGFAKLENRLLFAERMAAFLDEHIGK